MLIKADCGHNVEINNDTTAIWGNHKKKGSRVVYYLLPLSALSSLRWACTCWTIDPPCQLLLIFRLWPAWGKENMAVVRVITWSGMKKQKEEIWSSHEIPVTQHFLATLQSRDFFVGVRRRCSFTPWDHRLKARKRKCEYSAGQRICLVSCYPEGTGVLRRPHCWHIKDVDTPLCDCK